MTYQRRPYKQGDFIKIRNFLVSSHAYSEENWLIDRWNFCRYFGQTFFGTTESWDSTVGIWEDEQGAIAAIVNSEGEMRGEAFFQIGDVPLTQALISEMFDFAELKLARPLGAGWKVSLRVATSRVDQLAETLEQRGYVRAKGREAGSHMPLTSKRNIELPKGFRIITGSQTSPEQWALAHTRAFRNCDGTDIEGLEARIKASANMRHAPDYCAALDLAILDEQQEIAAFANVWHDGVNRLGILEPVGTVPRHRRKGLGKALISKAANLLVDLGANCLHVGSEQQFYLDCGFELDDTYDEIWQKISPS